ncbi:MAG: Zn-dependent hydrolase [Mesorhizobium sp.]|nr:MAG: Zn-dependent hydrolase [Mesorhizobium sp.]
MSRGNLPVDAARIARDLADLAALTEPDRPWTRRAFTPVFLEGRRWLAERMRDAGLDPAIDAAGNLIGRRAGRKPGRGTLVIGSHSDTVPDGGRYDGTAGVIAGLEVARALQDAGITLEHDLEIVDFLAEEVSIFGVSCIGSRAMTGQIPADWLERDHQGRSLRQAIIEVGGDPGSLSPRNDIRASLELHIEQGPVLETAGETIGIVMSITGITRIALSVTGRADHAGTTPMARRDDALVTAAGVILDIHDEACRRASDGAGHFTATVGEFTIKPGAANVVPGIAELLIDARASDPGVMTHFVDWLRSRIADCPITMQVISDNPPCPCDLDLCLELETAARQLGAKSRRMVSGAGHDTAWISKTARAAMIFVPCKDGRSHCPEESATPEDISVGADVLFETVIAIDRSLADPAPA